MNEPAAASRPGLFILHPSSLCLVVAGDRFDGADDLLVGDLVGGAGEGGVAAVHQDGAITLGVASQRVDQLAPLLGVERTEVHGTFSFLKTGDPLTPAARSDKTLTTSVRPCRPAPRAAGRRRGPRNRQPA